MGDDSSIVQAARVSYGKDINLQDINDCDMCGGSGEVVIPQTSFGGGSLAECPCVNGISKKDRQLIRYLMNHSHTTPFEMVEIKFMVQLPMDCWRQWVRHRTASINEYSTRYTEALDMQQTTLPGEWRLQATDNKQGSSGFLEKWPEGMETNHPNQTPGEWLTEDEEFFHKSAQLTYKRRLALGIAKEQARKDLPLSTYTRAYWKCDLHNIFNFLRLRMDSHAQLEIRQFANCMFEIVKQICPVACEAFEDYVLNAKKFSRMEMGFLHNLAKEYNPQFVKPDDMTDREWKEFLKKLS
jgi:thymidylate synthase (FAD)